MSEQDGQAKQLSHLERIGIRYAEFKPQLRALRTQAVYAYDFLRPKARHVGDVPRDFPLRHQQVHGLGGIVADYLMINLGEHHSLLLYHNLDRSGGKETTWELTRSIETEPLVTEETKIKEFPGRNPDIFIEVSQSHYPERWGMNSRHDAFLCSAFNDYTGVEERIAAFATDLDTAFKQHF